MAQTQESSVLVSIEELLRDAHAREEQERRETEARLRQAEQRRIDEARQRRQTEEAQWQAEKSERARRAFAEETRQVELRALHEGAIVRARAEAEARSRLAEILVRQEHERSLHALRHDRQKVGSGRPSWP